MNYESFIARRMLTGGKQGFSQPVVRLAIAGIALGLSVMIVSVAVLTGFQKEIRNKVIGFGGHIHISHFDSNESYEQIPVDMDQDFYPGIVNKPGFSHIMVSARKAGIIKTEEQIQGLVLKGIGPDFKWDFFTERLIKGNAFSYDTNKRSDDVLISAETSRLLGLDTADEFRMYFIIDNKTRGRKFRVSGIFDTGLSEWDKTYILGDIRHIQKLNGWEEDQVGGFDVIIDDFKQLDELGKEVYELLPFDLSSRTIREQYPQMFDWLRLQDINVIVILVLMLVVSAISMISTLLILILERTQMIGILKAQGSRNWSIRRIFLYNAAWIIGRGLLWGNLAGLGIALLQKYTGLITLPQESYYVAVVPINIGFLHIFFLNVISMLFCLAMLIIPSYLISKISPLRAIRFN